MYPVVIAPFPGAVQTKSSPQQFIGHKLHSEGGTHLPPAACAEPHVPGVDEPGGFGGDVDYAARRPQIIAQSLKNGG